MTAAGAGPTRIVVLGGGFAALSAARRLQERMPRDGSVRATLISRDNYLLFTPMLAEVAAGELAPDHIAAPLRRFLHRVRVWQGEAVEADLQRKVVTMRHSATGEPLEVAFDHLVLALGSVTSYGRAAGAEQHSLPFKSLEDAARARARVIDCFEQATIERDPARRRVLLTVVVTGGGNTGVELAASLNDLMQSLKGRYPRLAGERPRTVLVHHGARLLEELPASLGAYALRLLRARGIDVRVGTGVTAVSAGSVTLDPGGGVPAGTVFWAAGIAPSPFVEALPVAKDRHGAVIVDRHLAVTGHPGLWALGDCAGILDGRGGTYAPTAQNAEREGETVAENVLAAIRGAPLRTFSHRPAGMLTPLGRRRAVARLFGRNLAGLPAWLVWRGVYLAKLPGWDRKARVGLDWLLDTVLPPDIVDTLGEPPARAGGSTPSAPASTPGAAERHGDAGVLAVGAATGGGAPGRA
jgi:NADH:ubiquinone reductase (H+-translocating)